MDNSEEIIRRGAEAEALLANPMLADAFAKVASDITNRWATTDAGDTAARERLYLKLQVVHEVREQLRVAAAGGTFEKTRLERLATAANRVRARLASYRFRA